MKILVQTADYRLIGVTLPAFQFKNVSQRINVCHFLFRFEDGNKQDMRTDMSL